MSMSWLRKATCYGKIPHAKVGARVVYDRLDLDEYIAHCKVLAAWQKHDAHRGRRRGD